MSETSARKSVLNSQAFTVLLLLIAVGEFFAGYYFWGKKTDEIETLTVTARDQKIQLDAAEAKMTRLEQTIKDMEAGGAAAAAAAGDPAADYTFAAGGITSAWNRLDEVRRQFQGTAEGAELGGLLTTQDFNGVRGPDQKEIECFENLITSSDHPLLRTIFEHNAKEALRSGDLGRARNMIPSIENLIAFYLTAGDEGSLRFVEGFLTTGPAASMLQTKYHGHYLTTAGAATGPALESCVAASGTAQTGANPQ